MYIRHIKTHISDAYGNTTTDFYTEKKGVATNRDPRISATYLLVVGCVKTSAAIVIAAITARGQTSGVVTILLNWVAASMVSSFAQLYKV